MFRMLERKRKRKRGRRKGNEKKGKRKRKKRTNKNNDHTPTSWVCQLGVNVYVITSWQLT